MSKEAPIVIKGGRLIDGTGNDLIDRSVIVIEEGRISDVGDAHQVSTPKNARLIDAEGKTVMPGMIDLHVHLGAPDLHDKLKFMLTTHQSLIQYYAAVNAYKTLEAGFTTVRSMAWYPEYDDVALKRAIDLGLIPGPRVVASRRVVSMTSGHGDLIIPANLPFRFGRIADGIHDVRKAVREQIRDGADFIKTFSTGGLASGTGGDRINYTVEELKGLVQETHLAGKRSAAHSLGLAGTKNALEAGIDTLEHGYVLDDEAIEAMVKKKTFYVPTMTIIHLLARSPGTVMSEEAVKAASAAEEGHIEAVRKAHRAGVKIAVGTDTIGSPTLHGRNAIELELLTKAGLSRMDAIVAATKTSAEAANLGNKLGTLEHGKLADLILVDGNPLEDLRILQDSSRISMVMKDGKISVGRR